MNWFGFDYCMFFRVLIVCRLVVWHFGLFPVGTVSGLGFGCLSVWFVFLLWRWFLILVVLILVLRVCGLGCLGWFRWCLGIWP